MTGKAVMICLLGKHNSDVMANLLSPTKWCKCFKKDMFWTKYCIQKSFADLQEENLAQLCAPARSFLWFHRELIMWRRIKTTKSVHCALIPAQQFWTIILSCKILLFYTFKISPLHASILLSAAVILYHMVLVWCQYKLSNNIPKISSVYRI